MNYKRLGFREDYDPDNRIVKQEDIELNGKKYFVSTVDLGLDHGYETPLYYETMIFEETSGEINWREMYCDRYATRETAEEKHEQVIQGLKDGKLKLKDGYFEWE